jgi:hypothetical protein
MILCECGEFIEGETFKDYIQTSANPSTSTIGHKKCGLIFNFFDNKMPKRYSSRKPLRGKINCCLQNVDLTSPVLGS